MQEVADVTGARVIGYSQFYAVKPHGTESTAYPGRNIPVVTGYHGEYADSYYNTGNWEWLWNWF